MGLGTTLFCQRNSNVRPHNPDDIWIDKRVSFSNIERYARKLSSWLRGKVYWLLTSGPLGTVAGLVFRYRCFDSLGPVALPAAVKPSVASAIVFGVYEYPERVLINRWLPEDCDCIELGASIGIISRVILRKLQTTRRLFAVEASAELLRLAETNVAAAGFSHQFKSIQGAVHYLGNSVFFEKHQEHVRGKVSKAAGVNVAPTPCVRLSDLIANNALETYSLVMDIEGSEFDLLSHDTPSLANCRSLIAELHGCERQKDDFVTTLADHGLVMVERKHSVFAFLRSRAAEVQ